ncbi:lipid IV(A) 3-deoxy-D-manno-octulosonic acid transferase [Iodobacter fluviatilis]|uniref:3-deoxy-D-manno-octulosonic acid transferase n=1 Tax=Iodobacter fluviatilis TaxID=537 RepID=A0A377SS18_9NEIS|nr:lipid IV(A) 3-deoxy-D-manno-octulosonic acid transferase [Iodobacter fluviatilis]TCU82085.1 3-deoxy-D-manno-octulosonic-acid transferase [Iodobacter fluviatilis]STR44821.1 3-deoxy-D-manno-octulosonic-acid transferase [Iodobacter fluviatilis]
MSRWLYRALLCCAFPLIFLYLLKRSGRQPAYRQHWLERLGFYKSTANSAPLIWLHAVSVGETRAAAPLIFALKTAYPQHRFLISCMTPTGRATAQELFADLAEIIYLPYDYPSAVGRFLKHFQPSFGVLMETEIWPNLIHACADHKMPLFLANARLSEKSLKGYLKVSSLIKPAVARLAGVLAQSEMDAARLKQLGSSNTHIVGNIKFDNLPDESAISHGLSWRSNFGSRNVLLFASSRDGEETLLLDALANWPESMLLILVPRHPQRFDEVATLIESRGLPLLRRSAWDEGPVASHVQVLLGDSMGEMTRYYAASDLAIIGGSILPFGSQNLIEACALGTPVLLGPSTYNFSQAATEAIASQAAWQGDDAQAIIQQAKYLLAHADECKAMGQAGKTFASAHRGATQKLLSYLPLCIPKY